MEEIKGTAFEIIVQVNELKQVKKRIYECPNGNRFYLNKFGFTPVEIWNSESIRRELSGEIDKLKSEVNKLKIELDESDYQLVHLKNKAAKVKVDIKPKEDSVPKIKQVAQVAKNPIKHLNRLLFAAKRRELLQKKKFLCANELISNVRNQVFHKELTLEGVYEQLDLLGDSIRDINKQHADENLVLYRNNYNEIPSVEESESESKYTDDDMKNCFNESRLTHPMLGFKHTTFDEYIKNKGK